MVHLDTSSNGNANGDANGHGSSGFHQTRAPYLPDGYRLVPSEDGAGLLLCREDGSEVGSFEANKLEEAEKQAFEDLRSRRQSLS
jgi:hypothetical protein